MIFLTVILFLLSSIIFCGDNTITTITTPISTFEATTLEIADKRERCDQCSGFAHFKLRMDFFEEYRCAQHAHYENKNMKVWYDGENWRIIIAARNDNQ